jgi:methylmalonyl-CoA mutase
MLQALRSGWAAQQIESAFAPRARNLARRKEGITGVSEFPNLGEEPVVRPAPDREALRAAAVQRVQSRRQKAEGRRQKAEGGEDQTAFSCLLPSASCLLPSGLTGAAVEAANLGASIGQIAQALHFHTEPTQVPPLPLHPFAKPFEDLRDASDAWLLAHGQRPRVFLANMGSVAHYNARATYAKNFFEAGGFEVLGNTGFRDAAAAAQAFAAGGARIAVICSSDKLYPEVVPQLAPQLKAAGARTVVLAGNPGANEAAWRAAGVDRFIFIKCDVLTTLRDLLREEGVLAS